LEPWQIKLVQTEDIDQILEIERGLFPKPWDRASYENELTCEGSYSFAITLAEPDKCSLIIAYICFRIVMDEMHLFKIGVAKKWQHMGLATCLCQESIKFASEKGAVVVYLEVRISNIPAISFYRKLGFTMVGKRPRYYPETGEDALVMMKQIHKIKSIFNSSA
jgi:[ribosomal protein S18]-alanine N-acetyltransferase